MTEEQRVILFITASLFGLLVGSFLNVCIFRLPRACMSIVRPRSRCPGCLEQIRWYDNIPLIGYIVLGGKCRNCRAPISLGYPAVELVTGAIFAALAWRHILHPDGSAAEEGLRFAVRAYLLSAMIVATMIDWEFRILPDEVTLSGIGVGLIVGAAAPFWHGHLRPFAAWNPHLAGLGISVLGAAAGAGVVWGVGVVGRWVFRKEAMGFGDVKYLAMLGAFLGWEGVLLAFFLACLLGSLGGILSWIVTRDRYIAFGPYLSMGAAILLLADPQVRWLIEMYVRAVRGG